MVILMKEKERKNVKKLGMYRVDNRIKLISCAHDSCFCIPLCALCCLLTAMGIAAMLFALLYKQNSTPTIMTTTLTTTTTTRLASKSFGLDIYVIICFRI